MKKTHLMMLALVMCQFSCEPQEDANPDPSPDIDYQQVSEGFQQMFEGAFEMSESLKLVSPVARNEKILKYFDGYFEGSQTLHAKNYYPFSPYSTLWKEENGVEYFESLIDTVKIFNAVQKMYIKSLTREMLTANSESEGLELVAMFREKIVNSSDLDNQEKVMLLEIASGSKVLLEYIQKGGMQRAWNNLSSRLNNDNLMGRTMGCSVDWRSVWMDGVVGLVSGAVWGGYVGGTAGTFTVPILGTAAGVVGGAVFGGASGFVSGVSYGIVSDLFTTCFRSSSFQQTYATCDQAWKAFINNEIAELPAECFNMTVQIKSLY